MSTEVIYSRVPAALKVRVAQRAAETKARSEAAAIADLLAAGLDAADLTDEVTELRIRVDDLGRRLAEETAARQRAEQRQAALESAVQAWNGRAVQHIAKCPTCHTDVTGADLIVAGTCPSCRSPLTPLLAQPAAGGIDQKNVLMLLAAAGVVLGLVAISRGAS
jgi:hypothetical protein